jgi:hypothetical protein
VCAACLATKHIIRRGSDVNAKKSALAAWKMFARPKSEGEVGNIKLRTHIDALLVKSLHKVYKSLYMRIILLIGATARMKKVGSFWWRSITKMIDQYKSHCTSTSPKWSIYPSMGRSMAKVEILKFTFPELHSFLKNRI